MNAEIKSFVDGMQKAGQLAAETLVNIKKYIQPGISTLEIDKIVHDFTLSAGATPAPLGYHGFPKSVCTSVNECICHGVPRADEYLKAGDIINVDVTCILNGYFGDTSATFYVGDVSPAAKRVTECAYHSMHQGIQQVSPNSTVGDIGFAINKYVSRRGFYVVEEIGGHGIGRIFHDEPFVPSVGKKGKGYQLKPWTCITVEPMVNETAAATVEFSIPGSTIKYYETKDKCLSAQFEHTVLITDSGYEIMTLASGSEVLSF
jgi:methionyl aminopeptidase